MLEGSIAEIGTEYLLILKALNCNSGQSLVSTEAQASDKNHVLEALSKVSLDLRNKLGESLSTVEKFAVPVEQATTSSLEALHEYSRGQKAMNGGDMFNSVASFKRAISFDPNFAMAYASLGTAYNYQNETALGSVAIKKAYELRNFVTEREKFFIESAYYQFVTGDLEKACQVNELWMQVYPRDRTPLIDLVLIYWGLGQYKKLLTDATAAFRLGSDGMSYSSIVIGYGSLNRFEEAQAIADEALKKGLDSELLREWLYILAFCRNDEAGMARQMEWASGKLGVEDAFLTNEADTSAYAGRLGRARELTRWAITSAEHAGENESAAYQGAEAALREALFGKAVEARQGAVAALRHSAGRDVRFTAALALAIAGDTDRTQTVVEQFTKQFPENTWVQYNYLPALRAQLALTHGNAMRAIEILRAATPYELASVGSALTGISLYPIHVRGEAYLAAHEGHEAATEFQKILDHRGIVQFEPIGALARLGLARAFALQGDTAKSRIAYQDFLTLWKDADPDIPILKQAKAEYAKLQ